VHNGHVAAVRLLLDRGADVNRAMDGGFTPLYVAASHGLVTVAQLLLERGADANRAIEDGGAPLHVAAEQGHVKMVELLIDENRKASSKASLNLKAADGRMPYQFATSKAIKTMLQQAGARVRNLKHKATPKNIAETLGDKYEQAPNNETPASRSRRRRRNRSKVKRKLVSGGSGAGSASAAGQIRSPAAGSGKAGEDAGRREEQAAMDAAIAASLEEVPGSGAMSDVEASVEVSPDSDEDAEFVSAAEEEEFFSAEEEEGGVMAIDG